MRVIYVASNQPMLMSQSCEVFYKESCPRQQTRHLSTSSGKHDKRQHCENELFNELIDDNFIAVIIDTQLLCFML